MAPDKRCKKTVGEEAKSLESAKGSLFGKQKVEPLSPRPDMEWEDLLPDLIADIAARLDCAADLFRMSWVCCSWRATLLPRRQPRLPCLLLPHRSAENKEEEADLPHSLGCIPCSRAHSIGFPDNTHVARLIGAYEGGWIFLAFDKFKVHTLVNFTSSQQSIPLPNEVELEAALKPHSMIIRAAALSAPPVQLHACVAAAIVGLCPRSPLEPERIMLWPDRIAFWRMGSGVASCSLEVLEGLEDLIYYEDSFCFLTAKKNILVCNSEFKKESPLVQLQVQIKKLEFQPVQDGVEDEEDSYCPDFMVVGRYLVQSRGDLLMVVRIGSPGASGVRGRTVTFRVFRMKVESDNCIWMEMKELQGRMLFIGRGCSRSYEVVDGFEEGVFFHDEEFSSPSMVWGICQSYHCTDNGVCSAPADEVSTLFPARQYGCCNNGVWSGPAAHVRYWFPGQPPSTYSSPVWLLH